MKRILQALLYNHYNVRFNALQNNFYRIRNMKPEKLMQTSLERKIKKIIFSVLFLFSTGLHAQDWNEIIKLAASDRALNDNFGYSVNIAGDYAIVGAYMEGEDASGGSTLSEAGSAYIFYNNGGSWVQQQKIVASDRAANDWFGRSVAISGDYAIVGANGEAIDASNTAAGSAYIFAKDQGGVNNWGQVQKIVASDRAANDNFGWSVAISGDYAIVGAYLEDHDASGGSTMSSAGSAYIFAKDQGGINNWGQVQKIVASNRAFSDWFGYSVAISGDYAVVGANREDEDASGGNYLTDAGSAYIFAKDQGGVNNWGQVLKIVASDRESSDYFGRSVAISGNYAIVGADLEDIDAINREAGSAYIFYKDQDGINNWGEVQKIVASDRAVLDRFGYSVSISGDYAIVGAYQEDHDASGGNSLVNAGSAYIFYNNGGSWQQQQKIVASDRAGGDGFGWSAAISGNYAIVGAYMEDIDVSNVDAGAAYLFTTGGDGSLPVELASFSASAGNGRVTLNWVTESEIENDAFLVERSLDGDVFARVAEIAGHGSSSEQHIYSFTDENVFNGITYYYRLSDRDYNGVITTHNTISVVPNAAGVEMRGDGTAVIREFVLVPAYPNPFNPETTLRFDVPNEDSGSKQIRLAIFNMLGQQVKTLYDGPLSGGEYALKWDGLNDAGQSQPSGTYFVVLQGGTVQKTQKIILLR
jgi:hypothetical protein